MICKVCGSEFFRFNSLQTKCAKCSKPIKAKKPMKKIGQYTQKWIDTRKQFIDSLIKVDNFYYCHYCKKRLKRSQVEVDHKKSRSRHPELRYKLSNLVVSCHTCNSEKGSKNHDEFCKIC